MTAHQLHLRMLARVHARKLAAILAFAFGVGCALPDPCANAIDPTMCRVEHGGSVGQLR